MAFPLPLPLNRRGYDVFLSHAHADREFITELDQWLTRTAGFNVWLDARELPAGSLLASQLQRAIGQCRAIMIIASEEAVAREWVKIEYNAAMDERANDPAFRVVTLRVKGANLRDMVRGITWIEVPEFHLDPSTALAALRAFYPNDNLPRAGSARDVYISGSWHPEDNMSLLAVCRVLADQGFRLVGDAKDSQGFGEGDRVERIIASCGSFVSVLPFRGAAKAIRDENPYKYMLREIDLASKHDVPGVVIADPRISCDEPSDASWLRMATEDIECPADVTAKLEGLWDHWRKPVKPHYIFFATDLESESALPESPLRHLVERITGIPTIVGREVLGGHVQTAIVDAIRGAFLVIADISGDNVNVCMEAAIALTAGVNVELISAGPERSPPFMLGGKGGQLLSFGDDLEKLGVVHKIARRYRRRILNNDL
jgi:hypothetical protein